MELISLVRNYNNKYNNNSSERHSDENIQFASELVIR